MSISYKFQFVRLFRNFSIAVNNIYLYIFACFHNKRRPFMPHNDPEKGRWFWRESNALAESLGTSSIFIDADARNANIKI